MDDFDLVWDSSWLWVREDPTHWSLLERPGFMRITSQQGGLLGSGNDARNLLLRDVPHFDYEIETRVFFTPTENFQIAGLLVGSDDTDFLMLGRAYCDLGPPDCYGNGIYFDHEENDTVVGSNYAMTTTSLGEAYLRIRREGSVYTGYVSENGADWALVGAHTAVSGLVPTAVGLIANDGGTGATEIPADFDYFRVRYSINQVFLPLTLRSY